jgi:uncharacterized protein YhaN
MERISRNEKEAAEHSRLRDEYDALAAEINSLEGELERLDNSTISHKERREKFLAGLARFEDEHPDHNKELNGMHARKERLKTELEGFKDDMCRLQARLEDTVRGISRHIEFGFNECFACGQPTDVERLRQRRADFPFFVADETTFYDPTRFRRVVEYISKQVPYTVVTRLVPKERQSALLVEHSL